MSRGVCDRICEKQLVALDEKIASRLSTAEREARKLEIEKLEQIVVNDGNKKVPNGFKTINVVTPLKRLI